MGARSEGYEILCNVEFYLVQQAVLNTHSDVPEDVTQAAALENPAVRLVSRLIREYEQEEL